MSRVFWEDSLTTCASLTKLVQTYELLNNLSDSFLRYVHTANEVLLLKKMKKKNSIEASKQNKKHIQYLKDETLKLIKIIFLFHFFLCFLICTLFIVPNY